MTQTSYIGLDLAWSERNATGAATLRGGPAGATLIGQPELLYDLDAIVAYVTAQAGAGPAIVAVDAPLWVPNHAGRRRAEAELSAAFRAYQAGAHPANRSLLTRGMNGGVRGEQLVERLRAHGFQPADRIAAGTPGRLITEVYPHPAMVAIFNLERTLKYKAKPQRLRSERLAAWECYQGGVRSLAAADPPLHGDLGLLAADVAGMNGAALNRYEDRIDALFCAYIALYAHRWGVARCRTFGTLAEGWIFTPVPEGMQHAACNMQQ
jgi:predicted RNase H-like nuclease